VTFVSSQPAFSTTRRRRWAPSATGLKQKYTQSHAAELDRAELRVVERIPVDVSLAALVGHL
jgi:hypothetical protein